MSGAPQLPFDLAGRRVWVAGHGGMVGGALLRRLAQENCTLLTVDRQTLDLCRQQEVETWVKNQRPDVIFLAAAKVGGILANNSFPATFLYDNLAIATHVIEAGRLQGVAKIINLGSSCIYPRMAPQPIAEESLLTGPLEPTNEWYAIAKIVALKMGEAYRRQHGMDVISIMPTNLYGPGDNYDLQSAHVAPALLRKVHEAKMAGRDEIVIWGSGKPRREFLFVEDAADGIVHLAKHYSGAEHVNLGTGQDVTIMELAENIARVVGWTGHYVFDASKPDGTPRKLLNVSKIQGLGWRARTALEEGLQRTYKAFLAALS